MVFPHPLASPMGMSLENAERDGRRKESKLLPVCSRPARFPTAQTRMNDQGPFVGDHLPDRCSHHFYSPQTATKHIRYPEKPVVICLADCNFRQIKDFSFPLELI